MQEQTTNMTKFDAKGTRGVRSVRVDYIGIQDYSLTLLFDSPIKLKDFELAGMNVSFRNQFLMDLFKEALFSEKENKRPAPVYISTVNRGAVLETIYGNILTNAVIEVEDLDANYHLPVGRESTP